MGPFGRADLFALEVGRRGNLAIAVDVEGREPEMARADDWQRHDVGIRARHLGHEFRKRQLAHVPFAIEGEARENFVQLRHQPDVLDAFRLHGAETEVAKVVVILGGDRQLQLVHSTLDGVLGFHRELRWHDVGRGMPRSATTVWTAPTDRRVVKPPCESSDRPDHHHRRTPCAAAYALRRHARRCEGRPITTSVENSLRTWISSGWPNQSAAAGPIFRVALSPTW